MLKYLTLEGEVDKVQTAINRLRAFEPKEGYYLAFSGGKDSQCIYHLAEMAGVKFDAHYTITSVDPPELIRFIKKYYPNVSRDYPRDADGNVITMWNLIPKHTIPPTRMTRYCCADLKETNGKGRVTVTGVRWAESERRKKLHGVDSVQTKSKKIIDDALSRSETAKLNDRGGLVMNDDNDENRRTVENCYRTRKVLVNPIVDWEDEDVWEFLNDVVKIPHCELYDQGINRIGCIGCPMAGAETMKRDFARYPKYKQNYIRAFARQIKQHTGEIMLATGNKKENIDSKTIIISRNGGLVKESAIEPTPELLVETWINMGVGGTENGMIWASIDTKKEDDSSIGLISSIAKKRMKDGKFDEQKLD